LLRDNGRPDRRTTVRRRFGSAHGAQSRAGLLPGGHPNRVSSGSRLHPNDDPRWFRGEEWI